MSNSRISRVERLQFAGNRLMVNALKLAIGVIPIRRPQLLVGADATRRLAEAAAERSLKKILIMTTAGMVKRGQAGPLVRALELQRITPVIYDGVQPDPTWEVVNDALELLQAEACDGIVALGGGSAMDSAKVVAVAAANDGKPERLVGYFKGRRKPLPLFAVPTTAGSGSEATIAAVISDDRTHSKSFVIDSRLTPLAAALEPRLMTGLSPALTAATGMDALTHAIEAYIGVIGTTETDRYAREAVQLIFRYLQPACSNGADLEAREALSIASYKAGCAFTQASVGYVHAISHQLGAYYGLPHGLGNAILLPEVLEFCGQSVAEKLAQLAVLTGLGEESEPEDILAQKFVVHIRYLNRELGVPATVAELRAEDIPGIARRALREALLNYPVPRQMGRADCEALLQGLLVAREPDENDSIDAALARVA
ncbi:iron-containing alcohol dehydrogenase [Seongchinamella unica]|uniref:iron-containing alcohol dehydrogenase n=1 Tax=Seongchinamella unica TaxID=2547392 RepID=UPI0014044B4C|nr:iron-containing alcohol dehydrogenase [Seongchinamella unica]